MSERITEEDIVSRIRGEITDSLGYSDTISEQREKAMDYYYGLPFGNEVEGRSQFVDSTVQDTIEWIKPSLMRVFASGDTMVTFAPVGPEDVKGAKQATDYVNHVFMKDNPGWQILYSWFTDALMQKNGIVKVWWDESEKWNREEYKGLDDEELAALVADDDVEVIEHTPPGEEVESDYGVTSSEGHHIVITRNLKRGAVRIENVPPDEFLISREAKTIEDARFVCHRVPKTLSDLREMYPEKNLEAEDLSSGGMDEDEYSMERLSRYEFDKSAKYWGNEWSGNDDESLQVFWLHESFLKADYNNDGISELRKVCTVGSTVLSNDEIDRYPFVSITPIKIPHKFFGLSVSDLVMDIQLIKSTLMRNLMDNMYNQNFGRYAVLEGQANLDDLLTQRPGGIVRVKSPNAVTPLTTPALQPYSFQMLTYLDGIRESRSGVSKNTQGLNDDALKSHQTATAVAQVMTAAQARVELIARNFAETGVKDLMLCIYELIQKNQDKKRVVQLNNEWVSVRPDMWRDKSDCTISVGLGHGNRDQQMSHLSQMMQFASQAMSGGLNIVTEQNLYNMGAALIRNMGFQNVHDFLTDPSAAPQKQDPRQEMAQAELQIKKGELDIKVAETQIKAQKLQLETAKLQSENKFKMEEIAIEREQNRAVAIGAT